MQPVQYPFTIKDVTIRINNTLYHLILIVHTVVVVVVVCLVLVVEAIVYYK